MYTEDSRYDWGPPLWITLHNIAASYPEKPLPIDAQNYKDFFQLTFSVLPCIECRMHAAEYFNTHPPDMTNRRTLIEWLYVFHNAVNDRLGKSLYAERQKGIRKWYGGNNYYGIMLLIALVLLAALSVAYYRLHRYVKRHIR